jgi:hypothetical protein|tara:strand:+ start:496 stop:951 length:456 start_codon:yes stop_codon:yes gene_type:complete
MKLTPNKINLFLFLKLPSAYFCGVRLKSLSTQKSITSVKFRWINQNPFGSMFWAVQGMAAELATGALVMKKIRESGKNISMLVASNNATFSKKAKGRIVFTCKDGEKLDSVIDKVLNSKDGQLIMMNAIGFNDEGVEVSSFNFEWTLKLKK